MIKHSPSLVLSANAGILMLGTYINVADTAAKELHLTVLFAVWLGIFIWHIFQSRKEAL